MSLWLVRAGKRGQHENRFLDESRIYLTWDGLSHDLGELDSRDELKELLREVYPNAGKGRIDNHAAQIWTFWRRMEPGDWVVLPSKQKAAIHVGEITGPYTFVPDAENPYYHYRDVHWFQQDVPRSHFGQDLLYSFGAFLSICRIKRNDAEKRVRAMAENEWKPETATATSVSVPPGSGKDDEEWGEEGGLVDLEQLARDAIAKLVAQKFKGHGMEWVVESILRAKGYTTHRTPEGQDKGVDILAASGPMGFDHPRICVQVKSGDDPVDRPTLQQLVGTMDGVQAEHGLLVSWSGFRRSVEKEVAASFFKIRLWDQDRLLDELLAHYPELDEDIRVELPLKRVWTITVQEDET